LVSQSVNSQLVSLTKYLAPNYVTALISKACVKAVYTAHCAQVSR